MCAHMWKGIFNWRELIWSHHCNSAKIIAIEIRKLLVDLLIASYCTATKINYSMPHVTIWVGLRNKNKKEK